MFNEQLYIPPVSELVQTIITTLHEDGHEGVQRTLHHIRRDFHSPNLQQLVQDFNKGCSTCQRFKTEHLHPAGLLLTLPVPTSVWTDVAMDFIDGLPKVGGKSVILTIIDRFSEYAHFVPLAHPYTAESVAAVFFAEVVRLHGIPVSIVSDQDPVFTLKFWRELLTASGTKLHMSTAFHPQSDE